MNNIDYLIPFTIGFLGHILLNTVLRLTLPTPFSHKKLQKPSQKAQRYNAYLSNYTCIFHALTMSLYGLYSTLTTNYDISRPMTNLDKKMLTFSIAYNIFDNIYESWAGLLNGSVFVHHLVMIFLNLYSIFTDQNACILNIIYFVGEITNPLLCLHQNIGCYKGYKVLSEVFGVVFCVFFLLNRVFVSSYYLFLWNSEEEISYLFVFVFSFMFFISYQWSFQTFNKLLKSIRNFRMRNGVVDTNDDFYSSTNSLRYNKKFQIGYQVFLICLCFGPLFLFPHNKWY